MNAALQGLLAELEAFGTANDAATTERPRRMLNITRDTGEFLAVLVQATKARRILEIGTSNGYSTLWLAAAALAVGGQVTTVECSDYKLQLAASNFARSGVGHAIAQVQADAGKFLQQAAEASYDLIFLDSERSEYLGWQADIKRVLRTGGLLVVDNATSHAAELAPYVAHVSADADFSCCTVPVGNGEFLATRTPR